MVIRRKSKQKAEFGDFQTPINLAREVCSLLSQRGLNPFSILEPTCGKGNFLLAALEFFPNVSNAIGVEINRDYVNVARSVLGQTQYASEVLLVHEDFFTVDWKSILESLPDPLLVIGNPPWITNADLGSLGSSNLPDKSNFQNHRGIDAITGKSNFDISEWMLIRALEWIGGRQGKLAMLCKTSVARKILFHAWKNGQHLKRSDIYRINTQKYFGAAVDACLLVVVTTPLAGSFDCQVHDLLEDRNPTKIFGYREKRLVADVASFERWKHLEGQERYKWRSGVKHDCSKVMEFHKENNQYRNGLGELVDLEGEYLYPMSKSSDLANGLDRQHSRWMLVTQRSVGGDTRQIRELAPKTWEYLKKHATFLDQRASSIYQNRPRFSVFGVGGYSFALWKVGISGFYKKLNFVAIGPSGKKPVVLDDTCYFVACQTREEASFLARLLNSKVAKEFFSAFIFWDAKRPITIDLLSRLDLLALAQELDQEETLKEFLNQYQSNTKQMLLFPESGIESSLP